MFLLKAQWLFCLFILHDYIDSLIMEAIYLTLIIEHLFAHKIITSLRCETDCTGIFQKIVIINNMHRKIFRDVVTCPLLEFFLSFPINLWSLIMIWVATSIQVGNGECRKLCASSWGYILGTFRFIILLCFVFFKTLISHFNIKKMYYLLYLFDFV